ncbi:LysR substrate-binding domain-containing protein [Mesorhizobium sp.]|uniref:LysR substrate-binding domain-containing protein n=1 Tax=Mesorhizobium sp. TaxID=1871066 RepID=UPI0025C467BB|nr:LysR substrate-binding domain-containing protein [Mesorhizobium sp.]
MFEAAARHLNFSTAASELSITQPAVSHGIRQLEVTLGHPLFVREHRTLSLTTQGLRLYAAVASGFGTISETLAEISGSAHRDKIVASASTVLATEWLLPKLAGLRQEHPNLQIEIRCLDRDPELASSGIDIHIRLGDGNWPFCSSTQLWAEQIVPVCSPAFLERHGPFGSVAELLSHPLIHYVDPYRLRIGWAEWLRALELPVPANLPVALEVNDSLFAQKAAEMGEGISLGWRPIVDHALAAGRLAIAFPRTLETGRHHYAVIASGPGIRRAVAQFRDWLSARSSA